MDGEPPFLCDACGFEMPFCVVRDIEQMEWKIDKQHGQLTALREQLATAVKRAEAAEAVVAGIADNLQQCVYRICDHCNHEYRIPLKWTGNLRSSLCCNFCDCPNCGERDDPWVLIKVDDLRERVKAAKQKGASNE
jgi:hypothetical protein